MTARDMARLPCISCEGCGDCCRGMGDTVHLDPYDIAMLCKNLNCTFEDLLDVRIALHAEQGLAIPHLLMEEARGCCSFLGRDGRCGIHSFRPGFCRLFPLGRQYDGKGFGYFIVRGGCDMPGKTKVRIRKWLDIPDLPRYEAFVSSWHYFVRDAQAGLARSPNPELNQQINLFLLQTFYGIPYDPDRDFYDQFEERLAKASRLFSD